MWTVFTPPTSLSDRGKIAVVADPQGALFALLQTANGDPAYTTEPASVGDFFWHELWTGDIDRAVTFNGKLAPYQMERRTWARGTSPLTTS